MNAPAKLNVTLGQPVVLLPHTGGYVDPTPRFGYVVTRISPSGKFEVSDELGAKRFFNNQGYEVDGNLNGKVKSYCATVDLDVAGWTERSKQRQLRQIAAGAIDNVKLNETVRHTYGKEYMQQKLDELEALLQAARKAVAEIA